MCISPWQDFLRQPPLGAQMNFEEFDVSSAPPAKRRACKTRTHEVSFKRAGRGETFCKGLKEDAL